MKASPYHHAVTLYETGDSVDSEAQAGPSTPRRSHRIKQDPDAEIPELDAPSDTEQSRTVAKKQSKSALRRKSVKTDADVPDSDAPSPKKRARLPGKSKPKTVLQSLDVPHPEPAKWADTYAAIKAMRSLVVAPVDTMGCDQAQLRERDPKVCLDVLSLASHPSLSPHHLLSFLSFYVCQLVPWSDSERRV